MAEEGGNSIGQPRVNQTLFGASPALLQPSPSSTAGENNDGAVMTAGAQTG